MFGWRPLTAQHGRSGVTWRPSLPRAAAVQGVSGTFTATQDVGTFATVSTATASKGIHIVGVTTNGQIWHQLRSSPSVIFRDVELVGVGQNVGTFTAAACG